MPAVLECTTDLPRKKVFLSNMPSRIVLPQSGSQRWSGQSPADAIAIRRLEQELDTVLPLRRGSPL